MESVEHPRQGTAGERNTHEQDPELGHKRRSKRQTSHRYHGHTYKPSGLASSDNSSSSESGDDSGSDGAGRYSRGGGDDRDATRWKPGRYQVDASLLKSGGSCFNDSRSSATEQGFHDGARHSHRPRRNGNRRKGKASTKELEPVNRHRAVNSMTAELIKGLGRQAVENAVRATVRVILGGWKGMTTTALRVARKWQVRDALPTCFACGGIARLFENFMPGITRGLPAIDHDACIYMQPLPLDLLLIRVVVELS